MRRARAIGIAFVVVQFVLYKPPPGHTVPFPRYPVMGALVAVLAAINLGSWLVARSPHSGLHWVGLIELALDCAVILSIIWLFSFDGLSALWALLTIAVLEASLRAELLGALATFSGCSAVYVVRELWASHTFSDVRFDPASITYRLGIVLIVAVATGSLARTLRGRAHDTADALELSEHRSSLLRTVAAVSREIAVLEPDDLLHHVVHAALSIGFDAAEVCVYEGNHWRSACAAGSLIRTGVVQPIGVGMAGAVWDARGVVVIDDYSTWSGALQPFAEAAFHVVVGAPIFARDKLVGALIAGSHASALRSANQIESLELLASQAGSTLATAFALDRMREQAMHDLLTGLPNELLLRDRAVQALAHAQRNHESVAFCFLDLDRFKKINDSLGHDTGDELLKLVAGRLVSTLRATDTVARLGGDEFLVMLPNVTGVAEAAATAEKLAEVLRHPFSVRDQELYVTVSIGYAIYPDDGDEPETLRKHADLAMYEAKARGRNSTQRYQRVMRMAPEALELEAELHRAIAADELVLHFQPQIELATGRVAAVEALVRWPHRRRGLLQPAQFLPVAEESDLLGDLDEWVTRNAVRQARRWHHHGFPLRVAINVSDATFRRPTRLRRILDIVTSAGVPAGLFEVEVTETVVGREVHEQIEVLEEMRALGIEVSIDDFGIGYSMLGRLRDFPVDRLKIDRSFIGEITAATDEVPVVSAIVAMATKLGIEVVAEGVETFQQLEVVRRLGCKYGQGFVLAEPAPAGRNQPFVVDQPPAAWPAGVL